MADQSDEPGSSGEPGPSDEPRSSGGSGSPSQPRSDADVEALRLKRHAVLSTALPFPDLDWSETKNDTENLKRIRDHSVSLANSTLDWYLDNHKTKKWLAQTLHFIMFSFVALAAIPPLLKIGFGNGLQSACGYCDLLNNHTGELALVLLGIAGVAKLWDSMAGYTVDWMRFITTAARINQELSKFQFEWESIDLATREPPAPKTTTTNGSPDQGTDGAVAKEVCPYCGFSHPVEKLSARQRKVKLAEAFCAKILDKVDGEISVWANELKKRYDRVAGHPSAQDK
jgi:SMODS and SLOG-associating 2TM effector domain 2